MMKGKQKQPGAEAPDRNEAAPADGPGAANTTQENAEAVPGAPPPEGAVPPAAPAKDAGAEAAALKDRLLRLQADFDNFRKRTLREKAELYRMANEDLITSLLPVLDHLDLALASLDAQGDSKAFSDGVRMVAEQLRAALGKYGLAPLGTAVGAAFDPKLHEAISHIESAEVEPDRVAMQVRSGYALGEKLLRPAQVIVSRGVPPPAEPAAGEGADKNPKNP